MLKDALYEIYIHQISKWKEYDIYFKMKRPAI